MYWPIITHYKLLLGSSKLRCTHTHTHTHTHRICLSLFSVSVSVSVFVSVSFLSLSLSLSLSSLTYVFSAQRAEAIARALRAAVGQHKEGREVALELGDEDVVGIVDRELDALERPRLHVLVDHERVNGRGAHHPLPDTVALAVVVTSVLVQHLVGVAPVLRAMEGHSQDAQVVG